LYRLPVAQISEAILSGKVVLEMNPTLLTREDDIGSSLRDLVVTLFRRKQMLILTFLCVFAVAALIGLLRLHTYESHMSISLSRAIPALTDQEINSEAELLKSRELLQLVVLANGLQNGGGSGFLSFLRRQQPEADRVARAVLALARQIKVDTRSRTNRIELSYSSPHPDLTYQVLNSLGNLYLEKHAAQRTTGSYQGSLPKAQGYEAALEDAEAGLRQLRRPQGVSGTSNGLALQLNAAMGQSRTIEQSIAADQKRIQSDQKQMRVTPQGSTPRQDSQAADLLLQNLGTRLRAAETKRAQFLLKYAPNYPLVRDADQEVAEAKAAIAAAQKSLNVSQTTDRARSLELRERLAQDQADVASQRTLLTDIRRAVANIKARMVKVGGQSLDEADLEREAKADEQGYLLYLSKREQERTAGVLDRSGAVNVAIATPPTIPVSPAHGRGVVLLIASALAALVSFPAAFILDCFDPYFRTPVQVTEILGIAVVLAVPKRTA
jgi:uncharacterized protein involved in exopolysaccharide biosynthesis